MEDEYDWTGLDTLRDALLRAADAQPYVGLYGRDSGGTDASIGRWNWPEDLETEDAVDHAMAWAVARMAASGNEGQAASFRARIRRPTLGEQIQACTITRTPVATPAPAVVDDTAVDSYMNRAQLAAWEVMERATRNLARMYESMFASMEERARADAVDRGKLVDSLIQMRGQEAEARERAVSRREAELEKRVVEFSAREQGGEVLDRVERMAATAFGFGSTPEGVRELLPLLGAPEIAPVLADPAVRKLLSDPTMRGAAFASLREAAVAYLQDQENPS